MKSQYLKNNSQRNLKMRIADILASREKKANKFTNLYEKHILDKQYILNSLQQDPHSLMYAPDTLRDDKEFILSAMNIEKWVFQHASANIRSDVDVINYLLEGANYSGSVWDYYDPESCAVNWMDCHNPESYLQYVTNKEYVLNLIKEYPLAFVFVSREFLKDEEMIQIARSDEDIDTVFHTLYWYESMKTKKTSIKLILS